MACEVLPASRSAYLVGALLFLPLPEGSPRAAETASAWLEGIAAAAQAQDGGDAERAEASARSALAALPAGAAGARARLALGLALRAEGRFAPAAAAIASSIPLVDAVVRPHVLYELTDALARAGHPGAAAPLRAAVAAEATGPIAEQAHWREADALLEAGFAGAAARAYENLLADHPRHPRAPWARLGLASSRRLLGEDARAVEEYRKVWLENPGDADGRAAARALCEWRAAGGPVPEPGAEERLARVELLLGQARWDLALKALDRLDAATAPQRPLARSRLMRALALLQLGRHNEAETLALPLVGELDSDERPAAELVLARVAARLGRTDEASQRYARIALAARHRVPGLDPQQLRDLPDDAAYLSAWLYYDAGRYATAVARLARFLRTHPGSRRAEDARWFRAWSFYRSGRRAQAAGALAALERGPLREAALYWQARLSASPSRAARLYRAAFTTSQESWYGLLAAARLAALKRPVPPLPPPPRSRPLEEPSAVPAALVRATALFGLGLRAQAMDELSALARRPGGSAALLAQLAEFAGDGEIPFRMARDHMLPTMRASRWGHPQPFSGVLPASSAGFGVDPLLVSAVMRRESGFRRQARSGAAAEGLLQLIPPTAERLATVLGVPLSLAQSLGEPEVSVAFGAYYLGLLSARFREPALVLAAYNAGPSAAAGWARDRVGLPLDEWVEAIPYRETRRYVRVVMGDYAVYRLLYGQPPLQLDPARSVESPPAGVNF